jgi:hypothetical protein
MFEQSEFFMAHSPSVHGKEYVIIKTYPNPSAHTKQILNNAKIWNIVISYPNTNLILL